MEDQKPLPVPVKGSIPECIAWAGIGEEDMAGVGVEKKEQKGIGETEVDSSTTVSLAIYPPRPVPGACYSHSGETGSLTTADQAQASGRDIVLVRITPSAYLGAIVRREK